MVVGSAERQGKRQAPDDDQLLQVTYKETFGEAEKTCGVRLNGERVDSGGNSGYIFLSKEDVIMKLVSRLVNSAMLSIVRIVGMYWLSPMIIWGLGGFPRCGVVLREQLFRMKKKSSSELTND